MRDVAKLEEAQRLYSLYQKAKDAQDQATLRKLTAARNARPLISYHYNARLMPRSAPRFTHILTR